jgi:hypothetical protein
MDGYPDDAEEGESLYHITEDAAYVYTGSSWVEQTVTNHGQLAGISEGDHRSDQRVSDLSPLQSVNGRTGDVTGLFEAADYNPEADTHSRYSDSEASAAAKSVLQDITVETYSGSVTVPDSGTVHKSGNPTLVIGGHVTWGDGQASAHLEIKTPASSWQEIGGANIGTEWRLRFSNQTTYDTSETISYDAEIAVIK